MCPAGKAAPYSAPGRCPDLTHGTDDPCYDKNRSMMKYDVIQSDKEIRCLKVQSKTKFQRPVISQSQGMMKGMTTNGYV